ncbi:hypothetical protein ACE6H2_006518 [Prunus campanulata]
MVCFLVLSGVFCNYLKQRVPRFKFEKISNLFANSAFNALGRVLYFLKTTKVKDMTQESCERLQLFWEELETFRFDLGWLEPRVQYALGVKRLVQRAARRKRLREDVDDLENEIKRRKHNVVVLELKFRGRGLHLLLQR